MNSSWSHRVPAIVAARLLFANTPFGVLPDSRFKAIVAIENEIKKMFTVVDSGADWKPI